jgi:small-conductance mechanosensitive channel
MRTVKDINQAIMFSDLSNTDLTAIIDAVKWKRATLAKLTKASLMLGDTVQFTSNKTGMTLTGRVEKIAIKYVTVRTPQGAWRVPANMLSKMDDLVAY